MNSRPAHTLFRLPTVLCALILLATPSLCSSLDYHRTPTHGYETLQGEDSRQIVVTSGGPEEVQKSGLPAGCLGYATTSPTLRLNLADSYGYDRLRFEVRSPGDTTLIVNDPAGRWLCDDDSGYERNAAVTIESVSPGIYDVWVGSYASSDSLRSSLTIKSDSEADRIARAQALAVDASREPPEEVLPSMDVVCPKGERYFGPLGCHENYRRIGVADCECRY